VLLTSKELLPGDLISISSAAAATAAGAGDDDSSATATAGASGGGAAVVKAVPSRKATKDITIPCDCLLIAGSCIVNEASLTGESVPQMKETSDTSNVNLDMNGLHRTCVLFSGTNHYHH